MINVKKEIVSRQTVEGACIGALIVLSVIAHMMFH